MIFSKPTYLLPKKKYLNESWPTIAGDQYSSNYQYWEKTYKKKEGFRSTLDLIIPEANYINNASNLNALVKTLKKNTIEYMNSRIFDEVTNSVIVTKRETTTGVRTGILLNLDLDYYSFDDLKANVVGTEKTDYERLLQRIKIKKNQKIEYSHTIVFYKDKNNEIFRTINNHISENNLIYNINFDSENSIQGYMINEYTKLINQINKKKRFFVADGNHSLAASKKLWSEKGILGKNLKENLKKYSLVELVNIYDESIEFYPIHRVLFNLKKDFIEQFILNNQRGTNDIAIYHNGKRQTIYTDLDSVAFYKYVDDEIVKFNVDKYDFVHDFSEAIKLTEKNINSLAVIMPTITKKQFIKFLKTQHTTLPKKSFSIGHAHEKRYYIEGRLYN